MSTYTPIATQTLASAAASVTFSSIPQGYTDLILIVSAAGASGDDLRYRFNSDTGSNYSTTIVYGTGSAAGSYRTSNATSCLANYYGSVNTTLGDTNQIIQIMNYANSTTYKTAIARANRAEGGLDASVSLWRNTNAINSITLGIGNTYSINFSTGSTFTLYGIQVGNPAAKAQGGNIVTTDGTYVYHTFTSSGSFIPSQALTADYLVVAGGGGGAGNYGGGGGAGGMRSTVTASGGSPGTVESPLSLTAKAYPVTVGAGGAGGIAADTTGTGSNGGNSVFSTITSTGGGGGGASAGGAGSNGGSGGGAGGSGGGGSVGSNFGTASPSGQGFAGGSSWLQNAIATSGGGGGASIGGSNGAADASGAGGNGRATDISGSSVTYAGGASGGVASAAGTRGTAGSGGGGQGGNGNNSGTAGTVNLGGGGGAGGGASRAGLAGGSGIVIIRYAI